MPLYSYRCQQCNRTEEAHRSIAERHNGPECHGKMQLFIVPPQKYIDHMRDGYRCIVTGEYVTSRRRRREIMKEQNIVEAG